MYRPHVQPFVEAVERRTARPSCTWHDSGRHGLVVPTDDGYLAV